MWRGLARGIPIAIGAYIGFDERLAHLIEGGADIFLMPSRFEPCGLNQMYSLRYGTVPVVRATGGLVDTVQPYDPRNGQGTGFMFAEYTPAALLGTLARGARRLSTTSTTLDAAAAERHAAGLFLGRSAREYVKVYKRVIAAGVDAVRGRQPADGTRPASNG